MHWPGWICVRRATRTVDEYLLLKWLHIISATLLFGTGLGSAYYKWTTDRSGDVRAVAVVANQVVLADWMFTTPAILIQPVTGIWMASLAGFSITEVWIAWAFGLYGLAGACWLPVVVLQYRMRALARAAAHEGAALPETYWRYARVWFRLGIPAFVSMVAVFWLMVFKPSAG